jgi:hypothetical protein
MSQNSSGPISEHPVALGSFRSWLRLLNKSEGIDKAFLPRVLFVSLSTCLTSPLKYYERLRYDRLVKNTAIHASPIFIIGHWRSGTTHLHNLLCQDENMGYVSTYQALAPGFCLSGEKMLKPLMSKTAQKTHPTRIIDNIPLSLDAPQEDDFAIANMSPYSNIHWFSFPRQAASFFDQYVLFRDLPEQTLAKWRQIYLTILRKATIMSGGKRLVLKNPANTGRIKTLLDLFPHAKFIHIYRNPYTVFLSTRYAYQTVLPRSQVQHIALDQVENHIMVSFAQLMQKFLEDRALIPEGNLVEIKFENLEVEPIAQLKEIYQALNLPDFAEAKPAVYDYLDSIEGYQKNRYDLNDEIIAKVNSHWGFAIEAWGYPLLNPLSY